jgi:hypothetical protein
MKLASRGVAVTLLVGSLVGALAVRVGPAAAAGGAGADLGLLGVTKAQSDEIDRYERAHPTDLVGLGRLVKAATGVDMPVSINRVSGSVSAKKAQTIMEARDLKTGSGVRTLSVPVNAFSVAIAWVPVFGPPPQIKAHGVWNFRDNYVNGSAPDDFSSVQLETGCSRIASTTTITYDYQNRQTSNAAYLQDSGLSSHAPISGVRDRVSGFVMNTDHGFTDVVLQNWSPCARHTIGAAYRYGHNQDGGSVLGVSAGWGFLSVSYGGAESRLQLSTNPIYTTL